MKIYDMTKRDYIKFIDGVRELLEEKSLKSSSKCFYELEKGEVRFIAGGKPYGYIPKATEIDEVEVEVYEDFRDEEGIEFHLIDLTGEDADTDNLIKALRYLISI